jgi:hypothetical protein
MARGDIRATQREEVSLAEQRPVKLQASKRFFTSGGNDKAVREARALSSAFGTGLEFVGEELDRRNVKGQERALGAAAAGGERDVTDKNQGYNRAWDELDAEADVNFMKAELPEVLRGADWENLEEGAVQQIVSDYMKDQYEGIDPTSWYGQKLAPAMLAIEAETLATHRDMVVDRIKTEQRTTILGNLRGRYETSKLSPETPEGAFDYSYLGDQTNIFFDGPEKREVYWESIFDFAIREGKPEIIDNVPERFKSGDPTGINDPAFQDDIRAAKSQAMTQAAKIAKAEQDAFDQANDEDRFTVQFAIYEARKAGLNVTPLIRQLAGIPGTDFADITASKNFGDTQLDERESRSADLSFTAPLWNQIHKGEAGLDAIFFAHSNGFLGQGPQAEKLMDDMMSTARSVKNAMAANDNPDVAVWRGQINRQYTAALAGVLQPLNPVMHQINVAANAFYTEQIANGEDAQAAFNATTDRFDPLVQSADMTDISGITQPKAQTDFIRNAIVTTEALTGVAGGKISYLDAFAGVPPSIMRSELAEALADKTLTPEQVAIIYANID